jgi:branched-chain amino acid transport system permease protein
MIPTILINGLVNSVVLVLIAIGFSLTFGISGVANFAHGAFYLLSGYTAWMLFRFLGLPYPLVILISVVTVGALGAIMYWIVLLRIRGIILSEVVATFAIGVAILEFFKWMGFHTYEYSLPVFIKGSMEIAGLFLDYQRIAIVFIGLALLLFLWFFVHYTKLGLALRGIAQDEFTAMSLGIDSDWTAMISLALGSALVAVAAISILPLGIIAPSVGYDVLLTALAVAIVGGLESTIGIVVGSLILGYSQVIVASYYTPLWMTVVYLVAIVGVLVIKPSGLFGKSKELEERV